MFFWPEGTADETCLCFVISLMVTPRRLLRWVPLVSLPRTLLTPLDHSAAAAALPRLIRCCCLCGPGHIFTPLLGFKQTQRVQASRQAQAQSDFVHAADVLS